MSTVVHIIVHVICSAAIDADTVIRGKRRNYRFLGRADVSCLLNDGPLRRGAYIYAAWSAKRHQSQSGDEDVSTHEFWWVSGGDSNHRPSGRTYFLTAPVNRGKQESAKPLNAHPSPGLSGQLAFSQRKTKNGTSDAVHKRPHRCAVFGMRFRRSVRTDANVRRDYHRHRRRRRNSCVGRRLHPRSLPGDGLRSR